MSMLTKSDLKEIDKIVSNRLDSAEKRVNKRINKIDNKLDYAINFMDRDYLKLLHRVERIEEHLNLEPTSI